MEHAPFIWWSYGISALVLTWAALAPLTRKRRAMRNIELLQNQETNDDTYA